MASILQLYSWAEGQAAALTFFLLFFSQNRRSTGMSILFLNSGRGSEKKLLCCFIYRTNVATDFHTFTWKLTVYEKTFLENRRR